MKETTPTAHVYAVGIGFVDPRGGHVHIIRNEGDVSWHKTSLSCSCRQMGRIGSRWKSRRIAIFSGEGLIPRRILETIYETLTDCFRSFGSCFILWVRRRKKNFRSTFESTFESNSAGPEHFRQLAIQHYIYGGDAPRDDGWQYCSIRRFSHWCGARQRFELF